MQLEVRGVVHAVVDDDAALFPQPTANYGVGYQNKGVALAQNLATTIRRREPQP